MHFVYENRVHYPSLKGHMYRETSSCNNGGSVQNQVIGTQSPGINNNLLS